jgi:hypothetical protein
MIKDWVRPKEDDTTNHTKEVNLFKIDMEILNKHYSKFLDIDSN